MTDAQRIEILRRMLSMEEAHRQMATDLAALRLALAAPFPNPAPPAAKTGMTVRMAR